MSISIAVMNATKPPTVAPCVLLCQSATTITAERAQAEISCVTGVTVDEATVDLSESCRTRALALSKRCCWAGFASCSRTMRQASVFSSIT